MDKKIKHLEMLQGIINRMAKNSFLLKEWTVILVSAMFVLVIDGLDPSLMWLAFFPAATFWSLDGYYLWQERLFRKLYDRVRVLDESDIDFSMNTLPVMKEVNRWLRVTFSKTLFAFYGVVVVTIIIVSMICSSR